MEVQIRLEGGSTADELISLTQALRVERDLQGLVDTVRRKPGDSELGGAFELLTVAVGSGGVASALVAALGTWLGNRRSEVRVSVTIGDRVVEIASSGLGERPSTQELLEQAREALVEW